MLNLEPVGVSLFNFGCFPDRSFFFNSCVTCRHAVCFAFFTLPQQVLSLSMRKFSAKTGGPEYYPAGDGDFFAGTLRHELSQGESTLTFAA